MLVGELGLLQSVVYLEGLAKLYVAELGVGGASADERSAQGGGSVILDVTSGDRTLVREFPGEDVAKIIAYQQPDGTESLLVAGRATGQIYRLTVEEPINLEVIAAGLNAPVAIALDPPTGDLLVAEADKLSRIAAVRLAGEVIQPQGPPPGGSSLLEQIAPRGVAVDTYTGDVLFSDGDSQSIRRLDRMTGEVSTVVQLTDPTQLLGVLRSGVSGAEGFHLFVAEPTIGQVTRVVPRTFETTCTHTYDDGNMCPLGILAGRGLPQPTGVGAATAADAGSMTSDTDLVAAGVIVGHLVVMTHASDNTKKSTATVTAINVGSNPNKINIDTWGLSGTPAATWKHVIGAKYGDCDYTQHACILRGMKGPTSTKAALLMNKSQRDYFGGLTDPSQQKIPVRQRVGLFSYRRFDTTVQASQGTIGKPIPIPIGGPHKVRIKPSAWYDAGDFLHLLVPIGEARIGRIQAISVQGYPPDNDTIGQHPVGHRDSMVLFGFEHYLASGATPTNDSDGVAGDGLTTRQVKDGVGLRNGFGASNQAKVDTYLDGLWQFRDSSGDGYSLGNTAHLVLRIQKDRVEINDLTVELTIGSGVQLLKTDLSTWLDMPDMAELAMNACINQRWGGGMDSSQLFMQDFIDASVICRALVTNTQTEMGNISDNVEDGPDDNEDDSTGGDEEDDGGKMFMLAQSVPPSQLIGGKLTVTVGGAPQIRTITHAVAVP